MNEPKYEYRVVWERGAGKRHHIRQSLHGLRERIRRLRWAEEAAKRETEMAKNPGYYELRYAHMPPLLYVKTQRRVVGEWEDFEL